MSEMSCDVSRTRAPCRATATSLICRRATRATEDESRRLPDERALRLGVKGGAAPRKRPFARPVARVGRDGGEC